MVTKGIKYFNNGPKLALMQQQQPTTTKVERLLCQLKQNAPSITVPRAAPRSKLPEAERPTATGGRTG
jgi:hypothetical protein